MTEEDAVTILASLFSIAKGTVIKINEDSKPWPWTMPVTYSDMQQFDDNVQAYGEVK